MGDGTIGRQAVCCLDSGQSSIPAGIQAGSNRCVVRLAQGLSCTLKQALAFPHASRARRDKLSTHWVWLANSRCNLTCMLFAGNPLWFGGGVTNKSGAAYGNGATGLHGCMRLCNDTEWD